MNIGAGAPLYKYNVLKLNGTWFVIVIGMFSAFSTRQPTRKQHSLEKLSEIYKQLNTRWKSSPASTNFILLFSIHTPVVQRQNPSHIDDVLVVVNKSTDIYERARAWNKFGRHGIK